MVATLTHPAKMPKYQITLSRSSEQPTTLEIVAPDIIKAHAAAQILKARILAREKRDTLGYPKIPEDLLVTTRYVSEV